MHDHDTPGQSADEERIRQAVRQRYAEAATKAAGGSEAGCGCGCSATDPVSRDLYPGDELASLPATAVAASLGCGNPTALAELLPGQVVLDLGSGGGIDVLLSARRVGPAGKAYGLDMTEEMLDLARRNQAEAGVENAEFLHGTMEAIPLPEASVDVVLSNCVINLAADKDRVLREAYRVLRPGGRFAVSDVVVEGELPEALRREAELWAGCIAGALERRDYEAKLRAAGFEAIDLEVTRVYDLAELGAAVPALLELHGSALESTDGRLVAAFVRARKPAAADQSA